MSGSWTSEVIAFLLQALPPVYEGKEWAHDSTSGFQMGCEALVALGQAEEIVWGARALASPRLPDVLPRWDDICSAIISLAGQTVDIEYYTPDDRIILLGPKRWIARETVRLPAANIAASNGLGAAYSSPRLTPVLHALGLVEGSRWTSIAETVLWRESPEEWEMDFVSDGRFSRRGAGGGSHITAQDSNQN